MGFFFSFLIRFVLRISFQKQINDTRLFSWQSILSYIISKHFHSVTGVKIEVGYKKGCIAGWHLISQHGTKSRAAPSHFSANLQGKNPGALRNAPHLLLKDSVEFCMIFDIKLMNFLLIRNTHLLLTVCSAPSSQHTAFLQETNPQNARAANFLILLISKLSVLSISVADFQRMLSDVKAMFPLQVRESQACFWGCFSWWILCALLTEGKGHSDKEDLRKKSHPQIPSISESNFGGNPSNPAKMVFKWNCK